MDILIGLVIAIFVITAGFVGYHASQAPPEAYGHAIDAPAAQDGAAQAAPVAVPAAAPGARVI